MKNVNFKPLPPFKTYEEEARFWDSVDVSENFNYTEAVEKYHKDKSKENKNSYITIRLNPQLKKDISKYARKKNLSVSSLMRMWVSEKIEDYKV